MQNRLLLCKLCLVLFCLFIRNVEAGPLLGLKPVIAPADNPSTTEKIALGKRLFFDKRLSANAKVSCASCHQPDKAFSDGLAKATGINGMVGQRNTPTILNAVFYTSFFHDGRADSLEQQALGPLLNPIEHGLKDHQQLISLVTQDSYYRTQFKTVFSINPDQINQTHITQAIASYERTLVNANSAFDRYLYAGDDTALTESAKRGLRIFQRKGNCANCHEINFNHALFTDNRFYNLGVGFEKLDGKLLKLLKRYKQNPNDMSAMLSLFSDAERSELGRFAVTGKLDTLGQFKTPTLRNIALTAPYMHDGSMQTLEQVVDYYDKGGYPNPFLDPAIFPLRLTEQEKTDLVSFLKSLNGTMLQN
ncbi:MAG: c-type cytochrome [Gammaproteobacteria bacterium]|nr:c-type cytochrome [Gammaproteobacteria bacterium]